MSANIKVDLSRHVGVSLGLAATAGFAMGYCLSRVLSASGRASKDCSHSDDASSVLDTPRTNGSSEADLQRLRIQSIQQDYQEGASRNGSDMELGEDFLVLALLVRMDLQLVCIPVLQPLHRQYNASTSLHSSR